MVTVARAERVQQVRSALATGMKSKDVAEMLGLSYRYVRDLISDPDGLKVQARRDSYAGVCEECGERTTGCNGRKNAPRYCNHCAPGQVLKVWTEERIIAAIHHWVEIHRRPPSATEWLSARRNNGFPPRTFPPASACYRSSDPRSTAPFESWADAIEAAGYPRPRKGQYERTTHMPSKIERTYLVFSVTDNGDLSLIGETEATNNSDAVEAIAVGEGRYASVAKGALMTFTLRPRLVASREQLAES